MRGQTKQKKPRGERGRNKSAEAQLSAAGQLGDLGLWLLVTAAEDCWEPEHSES